MTTRSQLCSFAAAVVLATMLTAPVAAAPISGDALKQGVASADRQLDVVHYRRHHRHWRHGHRHFYRGHFRRYRYYNYGYRPYFYRPYLYGYSGYGFYPGISLGFGHHHHHLFGHHGGHHHHHHH